ncbi:TonB-dependent receptor [Novosphingobium flavum]|uniref:TonB-dependent receptor n=1 Tax=Novosphingobium aerophilum TaxID=2839843 RepID=A0A7X1F9N9_9SPHN|nr:TonB-dependent receptor [Novosphingobium aerophilum]MBC2652749.1 TonB-dependent receptor [Novosphingobium aerophilum]MBC2662901.1 TonB-dependent receptor [Novosphingobium aerophilum]
MTKRNLMNCVSAGALAVVAMSLAVPAMAQDKPADNEAPETEAIVVTASSSGRTAQNSSISVSQISQDAIANFTPRSQAEVLRSIPGLNVQDTAGPGGNANIGVRGIPVSTGGSQYVALQEDGLPVVLFGDMQFGNNDYWVRFDNNVDRVEAVRGGSASTFASQAPGAVINYVSKTGTEEGGAVALSTALNYREFRLDFDYGGRASDTVRYHFGGYVVNGNGPTRLPYTASQGYQIKGNITKDLPDGKGYIRLNFKRLDDRQPTFTSMPALATISGNEITGFSPLPGVDARRYASTGIYNQTFNILNANGTVQNVRMEGIHPVATSIGGEFHYEFSPTFTLDEKVRWTDMSGVFANQWTGEVATSGPGGLIGQTIGSVNGSNDTRVIGAVRYAAGPLAGQNYTGAFLSNSAQAYTTMKDVGSLANDLTLKGKFDLGGGTLNVRGGWFHMRQNIVMDWRINNVTQTLNSNGNPVPLNLYTAAGAQLTANGVTGYNNQWGGCCGGRSYDLAYTNNALYLEGEADLDRLNLSASFRRDMLKAEGVSYGVVQGANMTITDGLGSASVPTFNTSSVVADRLDYTKSYSSWSLGALYKLTDTTNVFVRASRGGRFAADRMLYGGNSFTAAGQLTAGGDHLSVNTVTQQEVGVKHQGNAGGARYRVEATFYRAQVKESNYDFTAVSRNQNPFTDTVYHSSGVELSGNVAAGGFAMNGYVVYTDSKDTKTGKVPVAMPKWTFLVSPSYDAGIAEIGISASGQSRFSIGDLTAPSAIFANGYVKVRPAENLEVGFNVNNLFNKLGYRANNGSIQARGRGGLTANQAIFDNSAMLGRTMTASIRYKF